MQPPSVEGWHEGMEWIDSGSLVERVNFVAQELSSLDKPGVRAIIDRLAGESGGTLTPEQLVDQCLDLLGPVAVEDDTRTALVDFAAAGGGALDLSGHQPGDDAEQRVSNVLRVIASTREYQLA